jgi:hypothetical protein
VKGECGLELDHKTNGDAGWQPQVKESQTQRDGRGSNWLGAENLFTKVFQQVNNGNRDSRCATVVAVLRLKSWV